MAPDSIDPISAKKALESMTHIQGVPHEDPEREALDREESREADYETMGLRTPPAPTAKDGLLDRLARILGRRP